MRSRVLHQSARLAGESLLRLQSDERLMELARSGHEAAFATLVNRHRASLVRYCAQIVGTARAEDAVQQTLIAAHDALTRSSHVRHFRSWLYRIAHNTSLNVLRAVRDDLPLDAVRLVGTAPGPDIAAEQAERLRHTFAAVQALPERQRAALLLRELDGRSHEEIGAALGVSPGAARQQLMRARAGVRHALTAVTPYPLLLRLLNHAAESGGSSALGEAAVGGGLTLAKLGTTLAAGTALVGGAVGTQQAVVADHHHRSAPPAQARAAAGPAAHTLSVALAPGGPAVVSTHEGIAISSRELRHRPAGSGGHGGSDERGSSRGPGHDRTAADDGRAHGGRGSGEKRSTSGSGSHRSGADDGASPESSRSGSDDERMVSASSGSSDDGSSSSPSGSSSRNTDGSGSDGSGESGPSGSETQMDSPVASGGSDSTAAPEDSESVPPADGSGTSGSGSSSLSGDGLSGSGSSVDGT